MAGTAVQSRVIVSSPCESGNERSKRTASKRSRSIRSRVSRRELVQDEVELPLGVPHQHVLEQNGIGAIVFHQQDSLGVGRHGCFSFTALQRKASMAWTSSTKP